MSSTLSTVRTSPNTSKHSTSPFARSWYATTQRVICTSTSARLPGCGAYLVWSKNLCRLTTRGQEEQCQFLSASVLWGMPARRDPLAPDHDCHDVIQLQGYHSGSAT